MSEPSLSAMLGTVQVIVDKGGQILATLTKADELVAEVRSMVGYLDPQSTSEQIQQVEEHAALARSALVEAMGRTRAFRDAARNLSVT